MSDNKSQRRERVRPEEWSLAKLSPDVPVRPPCVALFGSGRGDFSPGRGLNTREGRTRELAALPRTPGGETPGSVPCSRWPSVAFGGLQWQAAVSARSCRSPVSRVRADRRHRLSLPCSSRTRPLGFLYPDVLPTAFIAFFKVKLLFISQNTCFPFAARSP